MTRLDFSSDELMNQIASSTSRDQLEALTLLARRHRFKFSDLRWLHVEALGLILDQIPPSLSLLGQLVSPHDREADTWVLRGMAYRRADNRRKALVAYQKANSLQPGRGDVLYNIANILVDDRPYEAIEYYCKSLHIDPFNSSCWFNYALACLNVQDKNCYPLFYNRPIYRPL